MATRGVLTIGKKKYGIPHDAYRSGFGKDLQKYKKGEIKFSTLKRKYNLTTKWYPRGAFVEHRYTIKRK